MGDVANKLDVPVSSFGCGVKYVSLHEDSGYGIAARRYMRALVNSGVNLTWTPMVGGASGPLWYEAFNGRKTDDPEFDGICNQDIPYGVVIVHTIPEYFPMWAERERDKIVIGCTVWETTRIPRHWPLLLNSVDRLMVPCEWNADVFRQCGVTCPIDVIPEWR